MTVYGSVVIPPEFTGTPSAAFQRGVRWESRYWARSSVPGSYDTTGLATTMGDREPGAWIRGENDARWMRNGPWVFLGLDRGRRSYSGGLCITRGWWLIHDYREAGFLGHYTAWLSVAGRPYMDMWRTADWVSVHGWPKGSRLLLPGGRRRTV